MCAATRGHAGTVRLLRELGAGMEACDPDHDGNAPLIYAARGGHAEAIPALAEALLGDLEAADRAGHTAIMIASHAGHAATVRALAGRGASVDAVDQRGMTALHYAAQEGRVPAIRALAEGGGGLDRRDAEGGWTVVMHAAAGGHAGAVRALAELGADTQAFVRTDGSHPVEAEASITAAASPVAAGVRPPPAESGHLELAREVRAAASPASRITAATLARSFGHLGCARWLERSAGWRRLHRACDGRRGSRRLVALLRDGADPAARSAAGETPEQICALADVREGALPEDAEMTAVMRAAQLPWQPDRHRLFPRTFTPRVVVVLLLQQRLERRAVRRSRRWPGRLTRRWRQLAEAGLNARAPSDVWLHSIVPFLPRFWEGGCGARAVGRPLVCV